MGNLTNTIQNNALVALSRMAPQAVSGAIEQASARTGVDFAYLLQQAKVESSFNPTAKAKTSSATGLFQFIESTWLSMVEKYGDKHGISTEGMSRSEILEMRKNPEKASIMAAEFASENEKFLRTHYDGEIGPTELYLAHFLGAGQAAAFLNARAENGMKEAAYIFPKAAESNYNVFYDPATGRARTLDEIYNFFDEKFEIEESPANREVARDITVASYQNPFLDYPEKIEDTATQKALSLYQDLFANSLDIIFLSQMMDLPVSSKDGDFHLFSTRSFLK